MQAIEVGSGDGGKGAAPISIKYDSTLDTPKSNLVKNGGFEEGGVKLVGEARAAKNSFGWQYEILAGGKSYIWNESAYNVHPECGLPEFHCGTQAIRTHTDGGGHTKIYQDIAVKPNCSYSAAVWVRTVNLRGDGFGQNDSDSAGLILEELDKDGKIVVSHPKIELKTASPYKQLEKTIKTFPQTVKIRYILDSVIGGHYEKGHVAYDDCELMRH